MIIFTQKSNFFCVKQCFRRNSSLKDTLLLKILCHKFRKSRYVNVLEMKI
jgi:hypothetical protein